MCGCSCPEFEKTLHYVSPAHGGWGVIRVAALIPESYMLFVAPFACGRHGALGGIINNCKDKVSYLFIDEADIVSGHYEHLIPDAVEELFSYLPKRPKVLSIFVSCLDDLLGTDHKSLDAELEERFPGTRFLECHMNPFKGDTKTPPAIGLQNSIYSLLEKRPTNEKQINMIGNNAFVRPECELFGLLEKCGVSVKHIGTCKDYGDFMQMSESCFNLVLSPTAKMAAEKMQKTLGIPFFTSYVSYDPEEIEADYRKLETQLGITMPDFSSYKTEAIQSIKVAQKTVGSYPIAIDYQAVRKPFTLAKVLLDYGFNVQMICTENGVPEFEKEACLAVMQKNPSIKITDAISHKTACFEFENMKCLCIGFDCGYMTKSKHVVVQMDDEGLYGFYGIKMLMKQIISAFENEIDVNSEINNAGLVV